MATDIGVRDLKNQLSRYLQDVKQGRSITVTERGKAIAVLVPAGRPDVRAVQELVARGVGSWKGGKPKGIPRPVVIKGKPVSEIVIEERR